MATVAEMLAEFRAQVEAEQTQKQAERLPPPVEAVGYGEPPPRAKAAVRMIENGHARLAGIEEWEKELANLGRMVRKLHDAWGPDEVSAELEELAASDWRPAEHLQMTPSEVEGSVAAVVGLLFPVGKVNGNGAAPKPNEPVLPTVFVREKIEVITWGQLQERRRSHVQNWAVQGWLARGEISSWAGKVEHGKTTLMRELALCKARGESFLGHDCPQGRVFYAMLDADGENLTYDEFEKMGMTEADQEYIRFIFEPTIARMPNGPEQFFRALYEWQPEVVIIDPFARLKEIGDFNDYNNTYLMAALSMYSKTINAHFALPGHIPRGRPPGSAAATAVFGSISFGAGVNARFVVERKEGTDIHVLRTSKGKSAGFEAIEGDHVLVRDPITNRISLGKPFSFGHQAAAIKPKVLELINDAPFQDWTAAAIAKEIGAATGLVRAAAGMLFDDKKLLRSGTGKKGSAFVYCKVVGVPGIPAVDLSQGGLYRD